MQITFTVILIILASFSFLVVAISQFFGQTGKPISRMLLVAFLMANGATMVNFLFMSSPWVLSYPSFAFIGNTIGLLGGPLLYFYAQSLSVPNLKFKLKNFWHIALFGVIFMAVAFSYHMKSFETKISILTDPSYVDPLFSYILPITIFITISGYLVASIAVIKSFQVRLHETYSKIEDFDLSWLFISIIGTLILVILEVINFVVISFWPEPTLRILFTNGLAFSAFLLGLYFLVHALRRNQFQNPNIEIVTEDEKYGQHRLKDDDLESLSKQVVLFIENEQPVRDENLTLKSLAEKLPMTSRELSQVINRKFGKNFFDFINEKRVEIAMRKLSDGDIVSLIDLMLDCGFQSKSAFYSAFKKKTGTTPKNFLKIKSRK